MKPIEAMADLDQPEVKKDRFTVDGRMIIYAFRYTLGKPMAISEPCVSYLKFLWNDLPDDLKDQIKREITVFLERGEIGGSNEIVMWYNLTLFKGY